MADSDAFHIAVGIPLPTDVGDEDFFSRSSTPDSGERVTLKGGEKVFTFSKSKLVKDSDYFRACLNSSNFVEGRTSVIEFDDIEPKVLKAYLRIVDMTTTGNPFDEFIAMTKWYREHAGDFVTVIEVYRLADRLLNKPVRVELAESILTYMQHEAVTTVNKSSPEGIKWLFNTYKNAYDNLDPSIPDEANLQSQIAEVCCQQIDIDKTYALARTTIEGEAFLEAVLMATTQRMATLLQQTRSLGIKMERLEAENQMIIENGYTGDYNNLMEYFSYHYRDRMHDGGFISIDDDGDDDEEDDENDDDDESDEDDEDNEDDEDRDYGEDGVRRDH
ncbi:hypothetical protein CPAR01_05545 [Colletotrichum paranaense]|uniref:BTB domain-containing protein n=1 Tax=Colletotrichum paranaense TaxID=1914294 RepID=A0ABQ9SRK7_9PEZI|nr:uncharacterized protein CPAR01_05545 [Colletotrichum paranaense]KAK1542158.1 hypothetical protein CPAR01_05545 [Colletotrichum paranaense]